MAEENRWSTRNNDLAKGAVLVALLVLLVFLAVRSPNAALDQQESPPTAAAQGQQEPSPTAVAQGQQEPSPTTAAQGQQEPTAVGTAPVLNPPQTAADGSVTLSGSAEPGSTVELWAGETKVATVPVNADGSWSYTGQPEPGDYEIVARTVSAEGQVLNESEAVVVSVPVAGAVAVTVNEPQVDASGEVILSGTGEPGSTVEILDNGVVVASTVVGEDGAWTVRYTASAGEHTLVVQAQGQAGEGSTATSVVVTVPTAAGGHSYVVQRGDWLRKLARRYYGDWRRWTDIYEATNAKAAQDPSYHKIGNPNLLLPGWKLWIPEP